jgi:hypothetical protein
LRFLVPFGAGSRYRVMRRLIYSLIASFALILMAVACGSTEAQQATSPSVSPSAIVSPSAGPLLFAALESKTPGSPSTWDTVAIAGLDGHARAKATFTPMPVPVTSCMGPILQPSAHVAAGKVFYADAKGVIRSLATSGAVTTVTTFPMISSQQMLSFAVSPDGTRLLGTVLTVPTDAWPCDGSSSSSSYTFDTFTAVSGQPSQLVDHQSWTKPQNALALTGWDAVGPIGTYPAVYASQGGGPGSTLGVFVRVDAATVKPLAQLADPSKCRVWNSVSSGAFVCMGDPVMTGGGTPDQKVNQPFSVRNADGTELWHSTVTGQNSPFGPFLAPDEQHVVICCNDLNLADSHELMVGRDGVQTNLAKGFSASGWLDSTTVVGGVNSEMAYVAANAPGTVVSMGFSGQFVGTVQA